MSERNVDNDCLICKVELDEPDQDVFSCPGCPYSYHVECLEIWKDKLEMSKTRLVCLICRRPILLGHEAKDGPSIIKVDFRALIKQAGLAPHEELQLSYTRDQRDQIYLNLILPSSSVAELTESQWRELQEFRLGRSMIETGTYLRRDGDLLRHLPGDLRDMFECLRNDPHVMHMGWTGQARENNIDFPRGFHQENTVTL